MVSLQRLRAVAAVLLAAATSSAAPLPAQGDERDLVVLTGHRELRGRVLDRYDPAGLVLVQGTRRRTLPWSEVVAVDALRDRLAAFFALKDRLPDHPVHQGYLIDWAAERGLDAMAQLQAIDVVLRTPDHAAARAFLGHRRRGADWLWQRRDQWQRLPDLERYCAEWGHPWEIDSEHFALRCNADLRRVVDALFDLERLYVNWFEVFGEPLRLREVLSPKMPVWVWRTRESFPAWSGTRLPYFRVRSDPEGEPSRSFLFFVDDQQGRPERLFEVATQHLLYRTLADDPSLVTVKDRLCGWAEIGLGSYLEDCMSGPPGRARLGSWRAPVADAGILVAQRSYGLENLLHRSARQFFVTVASNTQFEWAASRLFVAWMLESDRAPSLRPVFFGYLSEALRGGKGDSSSAFDRLLGGRIETLEAPWREWVRSLLPATGRG